MKQVIYAVHGFLGQATDWLQVRKKVKEEKPDWHFVAVDLFQIPQLSPSFSFDIWTQNFYDWIAQYESNHLAGEKCKRTIAGYSLGGRLALHVLQHRPEAWTGAVFISTNPGLQTELDKKLRQENDRQWSDKFLQQNFKAVVSEWNQQNTLRDSYEPERIEANYNKADLSGALLNWSLALQKDFRLLMDLWNVRQIWIAGERDTKFAKLLKTLPEASDIQRWEVEGASHRLIFEAPEEVAHFIIRVSSPIPKLL